MGKAIAIFNQKGGVGKTTTSINLATCLAQKDKRILIIDIDPQGNTTTGLGISKTNTDYTIYDVLVDEDLDPADAIQFIGIPNLWIIPGDVQLAGAELEFIEQEGKEHRLRNTVERIKEKYDYIFIDCPPSLGLLTINSLTAVDSVLIPVQCEFYALEGSGLLLSTIEFVRRKLNPVLEVQGVILSMFDGRTNLAIQVIEEIKRIFKDKVYSTVIPRNIKLAEAPGHGLPITIYDPRSKGAEAYREFAEEFLKDEEARG